MKSRFRLPEEPFRRHAVIDVRSRVRLAMELLPDAWPMDTFIHHNPLNGLEDLSFEEAVRTGESLFGGKGYPTPGFLRECLRRGRVRLEDLEGTFERLFPSSSAPEGFSSPPFPVSFARFSLAQYLLSPGLPSFAPEPGDPDGVGWWNDLLPGIVKSLEQLGRKPDRESIGKGLERILSVLFGEEGEGHFDRSSEGPDPEDSVERIVGFPGEETTFSSWTDRLFGTRIHSEINALLSDAAALYLDEGQSFWPTPGRELGFYLLIRERWSSRLSALSCHPALPQLFSGLPESPEEAILKVLESWGIPRNEWVGLFSREFAALPGWSGAIKWRADEHSEEERLPFSIEPVEWLAIRLALESVMVRDVLSEALNAGPSRSSLTAFMKSNAREFVLRFWRQDPSLPLSLVQDVDRLAERSAVWGQQNPYWEDLWERAQSSRRRASGRRIRLGWSIFRAWALWDSEGDWDSWTTPEALEFFRDWSGKVPRERFGYWGVLAMEKNYRDAFLSILSSRKEDTPVRVSPSREEHAPQTRNIRAQLLFCIDVRSEGIRRHLERLGSYETAGLAGFFGIPIRFKGFGADHVQVLSPAILTPRHLLAEIHRPYEVGTLRVFFRGRRWLRWLSHLVHEMKNNIVTPYVFVEAIGWMSGLPLFGKTFFPGWYHRLVSRTGRMFLPSISTTVLLDKIPEKEARDIVLSEERSVIRQVLIGKYGKKARSLPQNALEEFRYLVFSGEFRPQEGVSAETTLGRFLGLARHDEIELVRELREDHQLRPKRSESRLEELSRMGLTPSEQVAFAETALSLAGLHQDFAPLVVFLAHKSTSDNNPYESALDCGACGGQDGSPNARVAAALLNRPSIRLALEKKGIRIPASTWFLAGVHDTTMDRFEFYDGEDWPVTHERAIRDLVDDLRQTGLSLAAERLRSFPGSYEKSDGDVSSRISSRSHDWAEVRPEWGLSGNAAFLIGRRDLTRGIDLGGRVFLQEYDDLLDPSGKILETLLSGPLVVGRWINLEHYFSTIDNDVYGSGSKVSHNVVGRFGVQFGNGGDLRMGLPWQTVYDAGTNRHEPIRLLCVICAPREKVEGVLGGNLALSGPFDRGWALLVVMDTSSGLFFEYRPGARWVPWSHDSERTSGETVSGLPGAKRGNQWKD
ncbi:MAG: DUF2309 domain-containing protein [Nitrospirae bacterium]|jgi:hypothetical protein|nr:DUF2309 domain-containing protein [Nitrospirota bacterium]